MKSSRSSRLNRFTVLTSGIAALIAAPFASAQVVWDGGAGDDLFGSGQNWVGDIAPVPGLTSDITFAGLVRLTPNNNYTAFDDFRNVMFDATAGAFTLGGSAIDLFGKIENSSSATQTVNLVIGTGSVSGGFIELNPVAGNLNIGGSDVFLGNNQLRVWGDNGKTLTFGAATIISGSGGSFAINQNSNVVFQSAHAYTGGTFINAGKLTLSAGGSANGGAFNIGDTTGTANSILELGAAAGGQAVSSAVVVRAGSSGTANLNALNTSGTNTLSGGVTLNKGLSVSTSTGGTLALTSVINGTGALTLGGGGTVAITANNTFSGGTTVTGGTVTLNGGNSSRPTGTGTLTIGNGAVLTAVNGTGGSGHNNFGNYNTGTTVPIVINGGTLNPSEYNHINSLTMSAGTVSAGGSAAGDGLDFNTSASVAPSITYNGATATATIAAKTTIRTATTLSVADGTAASDLTFSGAIVGAGSIVKSGAGTLTFSSQKVYTGGTIVNGGILDLTTAGGTAGSIRGTITVNSTGTLRLNGNDTTGFGTGTDRLSVINLVGGTMHVATILGTTGNQTLGSAAINLSGGFITGVAGSNLDFFQGGSSLSSLASATTSTVSGAQIKIRQAGGLTITTALGTTPSGIDLSISSPIVNDGGFTTVPLTKAGAGTLAFTNQKTYGGGTIINGGILDLTGGGGSGGTIRGSVTINPTGTLRLSTGDATGFGTGVDRLATINIAGGTLNVNTASNQTLGNATINMTGGAITGIAGSNLDFFQGGSTLNTLASATTSTISGVFLSPLRQGSTTFTVADGAAAIDLDISSVIRTSPSGDGGTSTFIKAGAGTMRLSGNNTYARPTAINAGTVIIAADNALGTNAEGTTVATGATIDFQNVNYATAEVLTLNGTLAASTGTSTFAGPVTLGANSPVIVDGTQFTLGGAVSGGFGITKSGAGTLRLSAANTYSGPTLVNTGTLAFSGAGSVAGAITVSPGAVLDTTAATGNYSLVSGQTLTVGRAVSPASDIVGNLATGAGTLNILSGTGTVGTLTTTGNLVFNGGTVNFDLSSIVASGNDRIVIGGALDLSAPTTLAFNRISGALGNGNYILVQGASASTGNVANLSTTGLIVGSTRQTFNLSTSTVANALTLDVAGSAANLIWNNAAATSVWSTSPTDQNWDNASVNDRFFDADLVTFQDISGQPTQTVGVSGTVTPGAINVANTTGGTAFTLNGTGKITGVTSFTKSGNGIVTLGNTGGNDYAGPTAVNAGTLRIGDAAAVSQSSTITIASGAKLDVNGLNVVLPSVLGSGAVESATGAGTVTSSTTATISAVLQNGTGGLAFVKNGTGTTSLTGANTYTGTTTIAAGTLQIGNGGTSGSLGATAITNDSVLAFNRSDLLVLGSNVSSIGSVNQVGSGTTAITGALSHTGGTTVGAGTLQLGDGGTTGSIAGTLITNATFAINRSDAVSFANLITGTGGFRQVGTGTTTLTNANTYTGPTVISAGILSLPVIENGGVASAIGQASNAPSNLVLSGGTLKYTGATATTNRGLSADAVAGNTIEISDSAATLTVGQLSGVGGFTKTGNGTLTLAGTNSDIAGGITVAAGALHLSGANNGFSSFGAGPLTVNAGAVARAFTHNVFGQGTGTHLSPLVVNGGTFEADQYNHINSITMTGGTVGIRTGVAQVDGMDFRVRNSVTPTVTTNAASSTATISSKITLNGATTFTVADGAPDADLEVSGAIVGGSGLTKSGNGTLLITGPGSYAGGTTITAGKLKVGAGGAAGMITGAITNNGALVFDRSDPISYASTIAGTGSVTKDGAGTLTLTAGQTYTGGTIVDEGILQLNARLATGGAITINPGAELHVNATNLLFFNEAITINGGALKLIAGAHNHFNGSLTLNGGSIDTTAGATAYDSNGNYALDVTSVAVGGTAPSSLGANTGIHLNGSPNFNVANATGSSAADLIVTANLRNGEAGVRGITKSGNGTMEIAAASNSTYTGTTNVTAGTLIVNGSISGSAVLVDGATAVVGGEGTTGAVTVQNGGTIAPGNSPGKLNIGTLTMTVGTALSLEINNTTPALGYDQLNVTGSVTLGDATLALGGSYLTAPTITNDLFFILLNDGVDPITGTFGGLADGGHIFAQNGQDYIVSYFADSGTNAFTGGNDVALMAVPEPGAAVSFLGGLGLLLGLRRRRQS